MADQFGDPDPGARGSLTIRDKAVQAVACATALEVDGVIRSSHGIGKLALRELPRVDVVVAGDHVRASLEVAVAWGRPLSETTAEVRRRVGLGLSELSGLVVDGVDVHVRSVVAPEPGERRKVLQ
ncbi:Asp23/Gls24 family envelope stress response protein [Mycolicibacterium iranicum]|uniref:Alkaline-shock protein n=1 Tax=Mycolicibacterium iranicum TaxID=912594 RepID=A0A178LQP0_MYCIR|nr:Asp23/Gls24 family envelope stress response protein [Mycolicibacterium iranicum]OAN33794.1 hypothetical protein A4X20_27570 [Mycolicibacterium iranicum]